MSNESQIEVRKSNKVFYVILLCLGVVGVFLIGNLIEHHFKMNPDQYQTVSRFFGDEPLVLQGGCRDQPNAVFNNGYCIDQTPYCNDGYYLASTTAGSHAIQCMKHPDWTPELIASCDKMTSGCQGLTQEIRDKIALQSSRSSGE